MSDFQVPAVAAVPEGPALTQVERVVDTFTAPSKTFNDIKRSTSWWLPFLLISLAGYILFAAVAFKVGIQQTVDNQIHIDPKAEARMEKIPPEQREGAAKFTLYFTDAIFIANPVVVLVGIGFMSLILWATINFVFAGKATYWKIVAVWMYAALPGILKVLLGVVVIFAGIDPENFNIANYAPTNAAAIFMSPIDSNKALYALATSLDFTTIWTLVLLAIGVSVVAGVKRSSGYTAVFGWWALIVIFRVGKAAIFG